MQAPPRGEQPSRHRAGPALGMRRIAWVRVLVDDGGEAVCHVIGTGYRLPTVRRVSLATALALAAEAVPCVVRSESHRPRSTRPPAAR